MREHYLILPISSEGGIYAMERISFNRNLYSCTSYRTKYQKEIVDCPHPKWLKWWIIKTAINNPNYNPILPTAA